MGKFFPARPLNFARVENYFEIILKIFLRPVLSPAAHFRPLGRSKLKGKLLENANKTNIFCFSLTLFCPTESNLWQVAAGNHLSQNGMPGKKSHPWHGLELKLLNPNCG
jgi:hypothetical protein